MLVPYWKTLLTPHSHGPQNAYPPTSIRTRICLKASGLSVSIHVRWHHGQTMCLGLWEQLGESTGSPRASTAWLLITKNLSWNLPPTPFFWVSSSRLSRKAGQWWGIAGLHQGDLVSSYLLHQTQDTLIFQKLWNSAHGRLDIPLLSHGAS